MRKYVELTAIDLVVEQNFHDATRASRNLLEYQQLGDPVDQILQQAIQPNNPTTPDEMYFPVMVYEDDVREFYPRRAGRSGTRIVFKNGAARIVKDDYAAVKSAFASLNN